tara:strand:+ start:25609 stop:26049 length:441 start_codon:yes stop_codon:yes gene_type:complete
MKKTITTTILVVLVCLVQQSCGGLLAGVVNRQIINTDTTEYVDDEMKSFEKYNPTDAQREKYREIQHEYITDLKENARKEKTKEISNSASINVFYWIDYKKEAKVVELLDKDQLRKYRSEGGGESEKDFLKHRKRVKKMGYNVDDL